MTAAKTWMSTVRRGAAAAVFACGLGAGGWAAADQAAADLTRRYAEAGDLTGGDAALAAIIASDPANQEARLGLGLIRFLRAAEHLSQGLYRYGLTAPEGGFMLPVLRMPVPENPSPEPVTYEKFRALLAQFEADLAVAEETLAQVGDGDVYVPIDLIKVRYDADGDGVATEDESVINLLVRLVGGLTVPGDSPEPELIVGFDRADAFWFRGYAHGLSGLSEFMLAYDWHEAFDATFHLFFPASGLPMGKALAAVPTLGPDDRIADLVSLLHLIHWPVVEPDRMRAAEQHFRQVFALSRQSWEAILAETDDRGELVPSPTQHGILGRDVTAEQVRAWHDILGKVDDIFDGKLLVPHWRLQKGFNLGRVFTEPTTFDLVLWITGPAALPYLEDGPMTTSDEWNQMLAAFGGGFMTYLFWFN